MTEKIDKLKDIVVCVDCQNGQLVLGKSTHVEVGKMFFTITPDNELKQYNEKTPDQQKKFIDNRFMIALKDLSKKLKVYGYAIHYELNQSMNLHIHGLLYIPSSNEKYDIWLATASKIFHKQFGRQYCRCTISSKFEWIREDEQVYKYVNKSNVYPPIHKKTEVQKEYQEYFTKDVREPSTRSDSEDETGVAE